MSEHPRQTLSYLRTLLEERGIRPKNKLGQNFLIDLNLIDLLVRTAELTRDDIVLEVGSGTGSLTVRLAKEAGAVVSVEIDQAFAAMARDEVRQLPSQGRLMLIQGDILKGKNTLNPDVLECLDDLRRRTATMYIKLIANLPYAVATPVISNLLLSSVPIERMVVMVQLEIAERMIALPDTRQYGALAILVQSLADVQIVRRIPPTAFWPRPAVDSAIIMILPNAEKRARVGDVRRFRHFLRDLYAHRRKNLRGGLLSIDSDLWSKQQVDEKLAELELDGRARAETLDLDQHLKLSAAFGKATTDETPSDVDSDEMSAEGFEPPTASV